jgi:hypothetical protein
MRTWFCTGTETLLKPYADLPPYGHMIAAQAATPSLLPPSLREAILGCTYKIFWGPHCCPARLAHWGAPTATLPA